MPPPVQSPNPAEQQVLDRIEADRLQSRGLAYSGLNLAERIEELTSRIKIVLPSTYPYRKALIAMAGCIAAQTP